MERSDFSAGTSSRSTKLIHGGVRYLQKAIMQLDYEQVTASSSPPSHPRHSSTLILPLSPRQQYKMVKEALLERANLLEIAPHLSAPLPIMLPVYK